MFPLAIDPDGCIPGAGTPLPGGGAAPGGGTAPGGGGVPGSDAIPGAGAGSGGPTGGSTFFGPDGLLAFTGADLTLIVGVAVATVLLGAVLFLIARRRRRTETESGDPLRVRPTGIALSLLLAVGLGLAGSASSAQAQVPPVDVVTACDFLQVTGVTVSPEIGDGLMPGETYDALTATITNTASFATDIFVNTAVGSDPQGIAPFTTLTAQTASTVVYAESLDDTTAERATRLQPGESVVLVFRAAVSPDAGNPQQAARIVFDIVITATEVP